MKSFLVANPKGGSGKTTLATNLAGFYARCGHQVMLGDTDRQLSARTWLQARPPELPPIRTSSRPAAGPCRHVAPHPRRLQPALRTLAISSSSTSSICCWLPAAATEVV